MKRKGENEDEFSSLTRHDVSRDFSYLTTQRVTLQRDFSSLQTQRVTAQQVPLRRPFVSLRKQVIVRKHGEDGNFNFNFNFLI